MTSCDNKKENESKNSSHEIIVTTTKNRSLLNSFIANPEPVLSFKNNLPKTFTFACNPVSISNFVDSVHICYNFSYNRYDVKYFETKEKPYGPIVLEIITLRDIRNNNDANDYFDKSEKIIGFILNDTINKIGYSKLIGKDTSYLKTYFGEFDYKCERYVEYNVVDNKLLLHLDKSLINKIEFRKVK
jgi:hypothetical protein